MGKKNEKRLCWNCEGGVSLHSEQCPYCGVDVTKPRTSDDHPVSFNQLKPPFQNFQEIPKPPYAKKEVNEFVTTEEWEKAINEKKEDPSEVNFSLFKELLPFLLLLPGIVFILFGLILLFFSHDGMLMLRWNQQVAIFYFLGAIPLLFFGWRSFRK